MANVKTTNTQQLGQPVDESVEEKHQRLYVMKADLPQKEREKYVMKAILNIMMFCFFTFWICFAFCLGQYTGPKAKGRTEVATVTVTNVITETNKIDELVLVTTNFVSAQDMGITYTNASSDQMRFLMWIRNTIYK